MAIWMDELEAETSPRWRRSDIALVASLAVVAALQVAVAVYVFDFGASAKAAVTADAPSSSLARREAMPETWATRFSTKPANPDFDGHAVTAGPSLWFNRGTAEARVNFTPTGGPLFASKSYAFNSGGLRIDLAQAPVDYRDTTSFAPQIAPETKAPTAVAVFTPAPANRKIKTNAGGKSQNIAALRTYLGESGFAAMGTRCGDLLGQAYKYDGGLVALCRQVRATL